MEYTGVQVFRRYLYSSAVIPIIICRRAASAPGADGPKLFRLHPRRTLHTRRTTTCIFQIDMSKEHCAYRAPHIHAFSRSFLSSFFTSSPLTIVFVVAF